MLLLCSVESLPNISGSIPFSVSGHPFNINISGQLFVLNYRKNMQYIQVLNLLKLSQSDQCSISEGISQHPGFPLSGVDNYSTLISRDLPFYIFLGGWGAMTALPVRHNEHHSNNFSMPFLYTSSPQGTAHNNILLSSHLPLSSKGWNTRESEQIDKPILDFVGEVWNLFENAPKLSDPLVLIWNARALRVCIRQFALNHIVNGYC